MLEQKLHEINERYKRLLRSLSFTGNLINEAIFKHQEYVRKVETFLPWLAEAERQLARESQEQMPSDAKKLFKKIEVVKVSEINFRSSSYLKYIIIRNSSKKQQHTCVLTSTISFK